MQPFLATECLGRDGGGGRRFIITFNMTRAIWRSPLLERYQTVSDEGSVKGFKVPMAYTRARATDVADGRERRAMRISVDGKGLKAPACVRRLSQSTARARHGVSSSQQQRVSQAAAGVDE